MAHKRKQDRRRQSATAPISAAVPRPSTPRHRHAPSTRSDPFTGLPLRDNLPTIVIRDYNEFRPKGNRPPIPMRIHRHEPDGLLGGCQWTGKMLGYIGEETVRAISEPERIQREWWDYPDIERVLFVQFHARYSYQVIAVVIAIYRDNADWTYQAAQLGKETNWLSRQSHVMRRYIEQLIEEQFAA